MARKSNNLALNIIAQNQNSVVLNNRLSKAVTFAAGTTGAVGSFKILTVTGTVALTCFAVCGTTLTSGGAATIEVGTTATTAGLIAQTTATNIAAKEIYHDATPDASIELTSVITHKIVTEDVYYKVATTTITGGVLTFIIGWTPISPDGNVELA